MVRLSGEAILQAANGGPLTLRNVVVVPDADIRASELSLPGEIRLEGNAMLEASLVGKIELALSTNITFVAKGTSLPYLGLGKIGETYRLVPKMTINFDEAEFTDDDLDALDHALVRGRDLSNCESWVDSVVMSDTERFELYCNSISVARLLAEDTETYLKIRRKSKGLSTGVIVGIVVGVVVVIVVIIIIILVVRKGGSKPVDDGMQKPAKAPGAKPAQPVDKKPAAEKAGAKTEMAPTQHAQDVQGDQGQQYYQGQQYQPYGQYQYQQYGSGPQYQQYQPQYQYQYADQSYGQGQMYTGGQDQRSTEWQGPTDP
jgi:hypothetical protein